MSTQDRRRADDPATRVNQSPPRLFVYGTLAPGRPNEGVLSSIGGHWQPGTINGALREAGWGAAMGYPGIDLDDAGNAVAGFVFTSDRLDEHWHTLDAFEGEAYERVQVRVMLEDGSRVDAWVYALRAK